MTDPSPAWSLCSDWITDDDLTNGCQACDTDLTHVSDTQRAYAITLASQVLFELTGRRWPGLCTVEDERPCGDHLLGCCECGTQRSWRLSNGPIVEVTEVQVDGVVWAADDFAVVRGRNLIAMRRADGTKQHFPCCQRLDEPLGNSGTFGVSYKFGHLPPTGSLLPTTMLARDYALACGSGGACSACAIPENVQSLVRAGMSITLPDPRMLLSDGLTGVGITDAWLSALRYGQKNRVATASRPHWRQAQRVL